MPEYLFTVCFNAGDMDVSSDSRKNARKLEKLSRERFSSLGALNDRLKECGSYVDSHVTSFNVPDLPFMITSLPVYYMCSSKNIPVGKVRATVAESRD